MTDEEPAGVYDPDEAIVEAFLDGSGRSVKELLRASRGFDSHLIESFDESIPQRLDSLGIGIILSRGIVSRLQTRFDDQLAVRPPGKATVLLELAKRAVLVSEECRLLLENGRAYGAEARWRTLYELGISSKVLAAAPDDAAEFFVGCETYQDQSLGGRGSHLVNGLDLSEDTKRAWKRHLNQGKAKSEQLISIHGDQVKSQFGWAHDFLLAEGGSYRREVERGKRNRGPTQLDLSIWCGFGSDHPYYALASGPVHGANPEAYVGFASERPADLTRPSDRNLKAIAQRTLKYLNVAVQNGTTDLVIAGDSGCSDVLALREELAKTSSPGM